MKLFKMAALLCAAAAAVPLAAGARAQNPVRSGAQLLGMVNYQDADITAVAQVFREAGGDVEAGVLPYTFNRSDPHSRIGSFILQTLPGVRNLRVAVHAYFKTDAGYQDFAGFSTFRWGAFRAGTLGTDDRRFKEAYLRRIAAMDEWIGNMNAEAQHRGYASRLQFVLVPYLEDNAPSATDYQNLVNAVQAQQQRDGIRTALRRSGAGRVNGLVHEYHGRWQDVQGGIQSGDSFSNDGNFVWADRNIVPYSNETANTFFSYGQPTSASEWIGNQRGILRTRGVNPLLWRPAYNGLPNGGHPSQRRNFKPFTEAGDQKGRLERDLLRATLRGR